MTIDAMRPPAHVKVIEERLTACGLNSGGFTVKYEDYLQSIEITITPAANVRKEHFPCISQAVEQEIVSFSDIGMQKAYCDFKTELLRPQMLGSAAAELEKRELLANFPDRNSYPSLELYAEALERHSGLMPRSTLKVAGVAIVFDPPIRHLNFGDFGKKYSSLMAVLAFAAVRGDAEVGFIGNEALAAPEDKQ